MATVRAPISPAMMIIEAMIRTRLARPRQSRCTDAALPRARVPLGSSVLAARVSVTLVYAPCLSTTMRFNLSRRVRKGVPLNGGFSSRLNNILNIL